MRYSEAKLGRVFVLRLEENEIVHETIEKFAADKGISAATVIMLGGAGRGSRLVVGPEDPEAETINPMEYVLNSAHEAAGVGTIFPDEYGRPILHLHASFGRKEESKTGCIRRGVKVWLVMEVVIIEIVQTRALRMLDKTTGFQLLEP